MNKGHLVGVFGEIGKNGGHMLAALAVLLKFKGAFHEPTHRIGKEAGEFIKTFDQQQKGEEIYELCKQGKEEGEKQLRQKNRNIINKQSLQPFCRCYTNFVNGICSSSTFF